MSRIKKIEWVGVDDYYDMHVPGLENYIGNGFVNHNTGKTKPVIDLISQLKRDHDTVKVLVVAPLSVVANWEREAALHSDNLTVSLLRGNRAQRQQALETKADIYVINYAGMRTMGERLADQTWDVMVCDESQNIKHRNSQQSKACCKVGQKAERRYILTGTIVTNKPLDVFGQFKFIKPEILGQNYAAFQSRYAVMVTKGRSSYPVRFINIEELGEQLAPWLYRVLKSECLDLPEKNYETRYVELSPEAARIYKKLKIELAVYLESGDIVTAPIILTKLLRFSQLTAGFISTADGATYEVGENEKVKALLEILAEAEGKVVVWTRFKKEMAGIVSALKDRDINYVSLSGNDSSEARQKAIDAFNTVPDIKVFVSQIEAGGVGINLTAANVCVYMTNPYALGTRLQSEDRVHRIGQRSNVTYIDIIVPGTVDEHIIKMLRDKKDIADIVNQDNLKALELV